MSTIIDARNLECPKPVIMTKKAFDTAQDGVVTTLVDNEIAVKNLEKLAKSNGFESEVEEFENEYKVHIKIEAGAVVSKTQVNELSDEVVAIGTNIMGAGSEELGTVLMKGFLYTLTETKPYPKSVLFYNSGVKLTVEGSDSIEDLEKLEAAGVEIISCGTCLNYYEIADKLKVGEVSNMYTIVETLKSAGNTIRI